MDPRLFAPELMGLEHVLFRLAIQDRFKYDAERNTLFINYEGFNVRTLADVDAVRREVEAHCRQAGQRIAVIINYGGFTLDPTVSDAWFSVIAYLQDRYYATASRYTTSACMRLKMRRRRVGCSRLPW